MKRTLQLENVSINDVLSLRPPDAMPVLTHNVLGPGTPATQFLRLHLHSLCGATLFGWHQLHLPPFVCQSLVGPRLLTSVCDAWQRSMQKAELTKYG